MAIFREPADIVMDIKGTRRTVDKRYQTVLFGVGSEDDNSSSRFLISPQEAKWSDSEERNAAIGPYYINQEAKIWLIVIVMK